MGLLRKSTTRTAGARGVVTGVRTDMSDGEFMQRQMTIPEVGVQFGLDVEIAQREMG